MERWSEPRAVEITYPVEDAEELTERTSIVLNWLLFPVTDTRRTIELAVISEILVGHSGSPLSRALLESGLGQDLSPVLGAESDLREAVFSVGVRGSDPNHVPEVERVVLSTLSTLVSEGLSAQTVEGALRRFEFANREVKGGPHGMRVMRRVLRRWMYGADPFEGLDVAVQIAALRERVEREPRYIESRIQEFFLENAHRLTVVVRPDPEQAERERQEVEAELSRLTDALTDDERGRIEAESAALAAIQEEDDSPQALATIPFLQLSDLPREVRTIPYACDRREGVRTFFTHELFTNGITYLDLAFDIGDIGPDQVRMLNLLAAALTDVGLPGVPHYRLNEEIDLKTGGISAKTVVQTRQRDTAEYRHQFVIRLKVLDRAWREGIDLLMRIVREVDFSDHQRLEQLLDEMVQEAQGAINSQWTSLCGAAGRSW